VPYDQRLRAAHRFFSGLTACQVGTAPKRPNPTSTKTDSHPLPAVAPTPMDPRPAMAERDRQVAPQGALRGARKPSAGGETARETGHRPAAGKAPHPPTARTRHRTPEPRQRTRIFSSPNPQRIRSIGTTHPRKHVKNRKPQPRTPRKTRSLPSDELYSSPAPSILIARQTRLTRRRDRPWRPRQDPLLRARVHIHPTTPPVRPKTAARRAPAASRERSASARPPLSWPRWRARPRWPPRPPKAARTRRR
jgi:hypothetical protein